MVTAADLLDHDPAGLVPKRKQFPDTQWLVLLLSLCTSSSSALSLVVSTAAVDGHPHSITLAGFEGHGMAWQMNRRGFQSEDCLACSPVTCPGQSGIVVVESHIDWAIGTRRRAGGGGEQAASRAGQMLHIPAGAMLGGTRQSPFGASSAVQCKQARALVWSGLVWSCLLSGQWCRPLMPNLTKPALEGQVGPAAVRRQPDSQPERPCLCLCHPIR